jgi:LDH2 family malate/lactate/ureidoglycolate dehydrogenase
MDNWINRFRSAKTIPGEERVLIPGDPEREISEERKRNGIPLNEKVVEDLNGLASKYNLEF